MCSLNVPAYVTDKDVTISFLVDRTFRSYTGRSIDQSIDHAISSVGGYRPGRSTRPPVTTQVGS